MGQHSQRAIAGKDGGPYPVGGIRGPLQPPREQEVLTVQSYMMAMTSAHDMARGRGSHGATLTAQGGDERSMRMSRLAWVFLRDARLFHFDVQTYLEIYHQMDVFCTETIAKLPYRPPKIKNGMLMQPTDVPQEETDQLVDTLMAASPGAPYPEHFPFESVFIGYGQGVWLNEWQKAGKFMGRLPDEVSEQFQCCLVGALMTFSGYVWEIFYFLDSITSSQAFTLLPSRHPNDGWIDTIDLAPWYLPVVLDTINDHKTFIVEGYPEDMRKVLRHNRKNMGVNLGKRRGQIWVPPPYYRVKLRDAIVRKRLEDSKPTIARQLRWRHDVRGHERCYIRRGPLPLEPETRKKLTERGYSVYEHRKPDDKTNAQLLKRGHVVKKTDEWVAVKAIWVDEHQRGPEDAPYVPALRTTGGTHGDGQST